jgi:hypothetical protein
MVVDLKNEALGASNVHQELWHSWNSYTFKNMISSTLLSIKYKKERILYFILQIIKTIVSMHATIGKTDKTKQRQKQNQIFLPNISWPFLKMFLKLFLMVPPNHIFIMGLVLKRV